MPAQTLLYMDAIQESKLNTFEIELILSLKKCSFFIFMTSINPPRNLIFSFLPLSHPHVQLINESFPLFFRSCPTIYRVAILSYRHFSSGIVNSSPGISNSMDLQSDPIWIYPQHFHQNYFSSSYITNGTIGLPAH